MKLNVLKNLYYDISHDWQYRKMSLSGDEGTTKTFTTGMLYTTRIFDTPFYGSLRGRYQKNYDVMENIVLTAGEKVVLGEAEIKYKPSPEFETYLRVNHQRIWGVLDASKDRRETRIYAGGSYLFDTTLRWGVGGTVRGKVLSVR